VAGDSSDVPHIILFFGHPEVTFMNFASFGHYFTKMVTNLWRVSPCLVYASMVYATTSIALVIHSLYAAHHCLPLACRSSPKMFFMWRPCLYRFAKQGVMGFFNWVATMWRTVPLVLKCLCWFALALLYFLYRLDCLA